MTFRCDLFSKNIFVFNIYAVNYYMLKLIFSIKMKEEQITLTRKEIQSETDRLRCENSQLTEKLDGKQREFQVTYIFNI